MLDKKEQAYGLSCTRSSDLPAIALAFGSTCVSGPAISSLSVLAIEVSSSSSFLEGPERFELLDGGTTTVISSSPSLPFPTLTVSGPSSTISTSSVPLTPFSTGSLPFV